MRTDTYLYVVGRIHIWATLTGQLLHTLCGDSSQVDLTGIAWNNYPGPYMFATGSKDGSSTIWMAQTSLAQDGTDLEEQVGVERGHSMSIEHI